MEPQALFRIERCSLISKVTCHFRGRKKDFRTNKEGCWHIVKGPHFRPKKDTYRAQLWSHFQTRRGNYRARISMTGRPHDLRSVTFLKPASIRAATVQRTARTSIVPISCCRNNVPQIWPHILKNEFHFDGSDFWRNERRPVWIRS